MARDHAVGTILTFLLGATVGAAVALVFAPRAGEVLRDDIAERIGGEVDQVLHAGKNLKRRAQKTAEAVQDGLQEAAEAGEEAYKQAKQS